MKGTIVLRYTVQKIVDIDIADFELTPDEIENKIDDLFRDHRPDDFEIIESDYDYFGGSDQPKPLGCEPLPTEHHWVDIAGEQWATNGWCSVTPSCPSLNDGNIWQAWYKGSDILDDLRDFFESNFQSDLPHCGYFDKRFAPIEEIGCKVYGTTPISPGWCILDGKLIAVIMPVERSAKNNNCGLIQFN